MKQAFDHLHNFFFQRVSASGFGLMRIAWAATVLLFLLGSATDVVRYYSEAGIMPESLGHLVFRSEYRYSLLTVISDPTAVVLLWCVFVLCLVCMMVGIWPRLMTIISVLLLFSFHEKNLQPLGGGDTVLRNFGFILMIAPQIDAFSIKRLEKQWQHWKKKREFLPALQTRIWPYRLLLWQFIIIYVTSGWDKLQGAMWLDGTVVEAVLHHTHFVRFPKAMMDSIVWISPYICFATLIFEFMWLLMLVPREWWNVLPEWWKKHSLKRWLILGILLFHWGIFIFMDVGSFPFAMTAGVFGLLMAEDFGVFKAFLNRKWKKPIVVLYDGKCGLCRRSIFLLLMMDGLDRLLAVNFRDEELRRKHAPRITEQTLDRAMRIRIPKKGYFQGFYAFRKLSWHLPVTRILTPLLYIPGVAPIGTMIYEKVAENRDSCRHGECRM